MKFLHFLVAFFIFITHSIAQQNHFIYIQTENKQPFYVRLGDRLMSSSSVGYIVIPKLQNGAYDLNIGFPKNEWPQQKIGVTVNNNDAGFVLKNFDSKGWGLFNMQTLDIIMSVANPVNNNNNATGQSDGFADVLADVVNTPSIKEKPANKEKEPVVAKTTPAAETKAVLKEDKPQLTVVKPAVKIASTLDNNGRSIVYVDSYDNKTDTVRIFIPYDAKEKETGAMVSPAVEKVKKEEPKPAKKDEPVIVKEQPKEEKKFLDIEVANPNAKADTDVAKVPVKETASTDKPASKAVDGGVRIGNSDCKSNASDDDFLKLRKKMAAQKTDENMIVVAKKIFITKCFTTEQISNLSSLFLKDDGRYNFFDAAYAHVSDTEHFGSLSSKLSDEYYINRFKAMVRH